MGWAIAHRFADEGSAVVEVARREAKLGKLRNLIRARAGRAAYYAGDVTRWVDVQAAAELCEAQFGRLNIVVQCAGYVKVGTVLETREEDYARMMDVGARAAFLVAKACVPIMKKHGGGAFVAIASVSVLRAVPQYACEPAAKAALVAMYKSMALDHSADNIRFNCVAPSTVCTPMFKRAFAPDQLETVIEQHRKAYPLGRIGTVEEIADAAVFLASDESSWTTGATGGWRLRRMSCWSQRLTPWRVPISVVQLALCKNWCDSAALTRRKRIGGRLMTCLRQVTDNA